MTLRLHDTAAGEVRDFVPLEQGRAGIYVCGLTVQSEPHVGHVRSAVNFDVLRRWLLAAGYDVTFIRNITDIDDKILVKSAEENEPFWQIAYATDQNGTACSVAFFRILSSMSVMLRTNRTRCPEWSNQRRSTS